MEVGKEIQDDFRDGFQPQDSDIFIAVMGVTGAGKSTFISHCTQKAVKIGHDLQACKCIPSSVAYKGVQSV
jgi:type IV secretory pathway VirB4 component